MMKQYTLEEVLEEVCRLDFAEFEDTPERKFSLKHRLAMKRIFARYERNLQQSSSDIAAPIEHNRTLLSFKRRLLIVLCIIVLLTFFVGWVTTFVSKNFHGIVYNDRTQLFAVDLENSPQHIEDKYALISVPEGFEIIETSLTPTSFYTLYMNKSTRQTIVLEQWVKSNFQTNFNTEYHRLEDIIINSCSGYFIDFSDDKHNSSLVVWDNGDYIIQVIADLTKEDVINLAKSAKVLPN